MHFKNKNLFFLSARCVFRDQGPDATPLPGGQRTPRHLPDAVESNDGARPRIPAPSVTEELHMLDPFRVVTINEVDDYEETLPENERIQFYLNRIQDYEGVDGQNNKVRQVLRGMLSELRRYDIRNNTHKTREFADIVLSSYDKSPLMPDNPHSWDDKVTLRNVLWTKGQYNALEPIFDYIDDYYKFLTDREMGFILGKLTLAREENFKTRAEHVILPDDLADEIKAGSLLGEYEKYLYECLERLRAAGGASWQQNRREAWLAENVVTPDQFFLKRVKAAKQLGEKIKKAFPYVAVEVDSIYGWTIKLNGLHDREFSLGVEYDFKTDKISLAERYYNDALVKEINKKLSVKE